MATQDVTRNTLATCTDAPDVRNWCQKVSKNIYFPRPGWAAVAAVAVLATVSSRTGVCRAGQNPLQDHPIPPKTLVAADDGGHLIFLDPTELTVEVWSTGGKKLHSRKVRSPAANARPTGVALHGDRALVAFVRDDQPAHTCVLLTFDDTTPPATFVGGEVPSRLYASPDGWLFEQLAPGDEPTIERFASDGSYLGRLDPPSEPVARARASFSDPSYSFFRLVDANASLWALPSFNYELWHLDADSHWRQVELPPCLAVRARYVEGEPARQRMLARADRMPEAEAHRLRDRVAWTRSMGLPVRSYATAVRGAVAYRERLAVVTEPNPDRLDGGCRLDLWDLRRGRPLTSLPVPGPCPALVGMDRDAAWLDRDGALIRLELPSPNWETCSRDGG